jgi:uncharacterized protein YlxW (UPF0749 family)
MINYLALLAALLVSCVSAYYSIIGLTAIFASQFWPIVIMGSVLELSKLITASWLYRNWKITPILMKIYLTFAVCVLMFITSMGTFGFLSKAHIDQSLVINTGTKDEVAIIQQKIDFEKESNEDLNKQISQIDTALNKLTEKGQASSSLKAADQQRKTRDELLRKKEEHVKNISQLTSQRIKLDSEVKKLEAEVGPIKYIANLIYEKSDNDQLEKAVRFVILMLVIVFDPLAVVLMIAANHGILMNKRLTKRPGIFTIDSEKVFDINE